MSASDSQFYHGRISSIDWCSRGSGSTRYSQSMELAGARLRLIAPEGIEPPTNGLGNRCSILLSYGAVVEV